MRALTRAWQILFKGFEEVTKAGNALQAAEMVLVRLAHAADLPTPDELIAKLGNQPSPRSRADRAGHAVHRRRRRCRRRCASKPRASRQPRSPRPRARHARWPAPRTYLELVALAGEKRDMIVKMALESSLRPVSFADGRLEVALVEGADPGIIQTLSARLETWTGQRWLVTVKTNAPAWPDDPRAARRRSKQRPRPRRTRTRWSRRSSRPSPAPRCA